MTALLLAVLIEIPLVAAGSLIAAHRMLLDHQEVMAAVIARKSRDVRDALAAAEVRISQAARTGTLSRQGPARLRD